MTPIKKQKFSFLFIFMFSFGTLLFTSCDKETLILPDEAATEITANSLELDRPIDPIDEPISRPVNDPTATMPEPQQLPLSMDLELLAPQTTQKSLSEEVATPVAPIGAYSPVSNSNVIDVSPQFLGHISDYTTAIEGYTQEQDPEVYELEEENNHDLPEDK